jgi:hypothetical protein
MADCAVSWQVSSPRSAEDQDPLAPDLDGVAARHPKQFSDGADRRLGVIGQVRVFDRRIGRGAVVIAKFVDARHGRPTARAPARSCVALATAGRKRAPNSAALDLFDTVYQSIR